MRDSATDKQTAKAQRRYRNQYKLIADSGFLDPEYYLGQLDAPEAVPDPIEHYLREGASAGLNPSRLFDTGYYKSAHLAPRRQLNPLVHFLNHGRKQHLASTAEPSDWDSRDMHSGNFAPGKRTRQIFVIPFSLRERNTTRYRANHLVELLEGEAVMKINIKHLPDGFWESIETGAILVVQRLPFGPKVSGFFKRIKASPTLIVYDIDDQIFDGNELEDWRTAKLSHKVREMAECMAVADMFLVSTNELRAKVERRFQRPAYVFQNCLSREIVARSTEAQSGPKLPKFVVGYAAGSATHDHDLHAALPGIEAFLSANPKSEFHCIGHVSLPPDFTEKFKSRIVLSDPVPWRDLPAELARHTVHIVPLEDCRFNSYKSHIRFLEAAAVGVPTVGSAVGEQARTICDGRTGILCRNTAESWRRALQDLHDSPALRERLSTSAREFVLRHYTTSSRLLRYRSQAALDDFERGIMRDFISFVVAPAKNAEDISQTVESILSTTTHPFEVLIWNDPSNPGLADYVSGLERPNVMIYDFGEPSGKAPASNHLFRQAVGRFVCAPDDDFVFPSNWDGLMIRTARTIPDLGWLSTNLNRASSGERQHGLPTDFPGGASTLRPPKVGGWVMFTSASARQKIGEYAEDDPEDGLDGDYDRRAQEMGLYAGYVRRIVGRHRTNQPKYDLPWSLGVDR